MYKHDIGYTRSNGEEYTHKGYKLRGWFDPITEKWYRDKINTIKNGKIVEIGVFGGASILSTVDICIKNNNIICGIDPWEKMVNMNGEDIKDVKKLKQAQKLLLDHRLNLQKIIKELGYKHIKLIQGLSGDKKILDKFENESLDLIFIDGNHSYIGALSDLQLWEPKLKKSGTLVGHDWHLKSVQKAANEFCASNGFKLIIHHNVMWEVIR